MPTLDILVIIKWIIRIMFWGIVISAWIFIIQFILNALIGGGGTGTVITDLLAMVQVWSPFHISSLITWITVSGSAYLTYRLAMTLYGFLNILIGED